MEWAIVGALTLFAVVIYFWVRAQNAEAYKEANKEAQDKIRDLQEAALQAHSARTEEDRRLAKEIIRKRDALAAGRLLRDSTGDDFN